MFQGFNGEQNEHHAKMKKKVEIFKPIIILCNSPHKRKLRFFKDTEHKPQVTFKYQFFPILGRILLSGRPSKSSTASFRWTTS